MISFVSPEIALRISGAGIRSQLDISGERVQYLPHTPKRINLSEVDTVEVTKALAALQPLYGKDNVEIITTDGRRIRGTVRSMKTTQALTTPSVKILCPDGQIVKIPFPTIAEIKSHN